MKTINYILVILVAVFATLYFSERSENKMLIAQVAQAAGVEYALNDDSAEKQDVLGEYAQKAEDAWASSVAWVKTKFEKTSGINLEFEQTMFAHQEISSFEISESESFQLESTVPSEGSYFQTDDEGAFALIVPELNECGFASKGGGMNADLFPSLEMDQLGNTATDKKAASTILYEIPDNDPDVYNREAFPMAATEIYRILNTGTVNYVGGVRKEMIAVKEIIDEKFQLIPVAERLGVIAFIAAATDEALYWKNASHYSPVGDKIFREGEVMINLNTRGDKSRGIEGSAYGAIQFIDLSRNVAFGQHVRYPYTEAELATIADAKVLGRDFLGDIELSYKAWELFHARETAGEHFVKKAKRYGFDPTDISVRVACWNAGVTGFLVNGNARGYKKRFETHREMLTKRIAKVNDESQKLAGNL